MAIPDRVVPWAGTVKVPVSATAARPEWERKLLLAALANGEGASKQLRYVCRIAMDANEAFARIMVRKGDRAIEYRLDPQTKAQFGRNKRDLPFLTLGLVNQETGDKYQLNWEGDNVPLKMQELAVRHDEGVAVRACTISLDLQKARVTLKGTRAPQPPPSQRGGDPLKKRVYSTNRLCRNDLKRSS